MTKEELNRLKELDSLTIIPFDKCDCYLHNRHRWVLPLIFDAQENGKLPKPCTLIMFDYHKDDLSPSDECINKIENILKAGISFDNLLKLCTDNNTFDTLNPINDDWLIAGIKLNLIEKAYICISGDNDVDCSNNDQITIIPTLGETIQDTDNLSLVQDFSKTKLIENIKSEKKPFVLSIDLDFFTISKYPNCPIPWTDELFKKLFNENGKNVFNNLLNRTSLLLIAKEPNCCGGLEYSHKILIQLNKHLFDNKLEIPKNIL